MMPLQEATNEPLDSEYSYAEMKEALIRGDMYNLTKRDAELRAMGIPDDERIRTLQSEFGALNDWFPDPDIGGGIVPDLTLHIPDTGYPPFLPLPVDADTQWMGNIGINGKNPDPPGYAGGRGDNDQLNKLSQYQTNAPSNRVEKSQIVEDPMYGAIGNDPESQPPTIGVTPYLVDAAIPPWRRDEVEQDQMSELEVTKGKDGKFIKPTTKGELMTDRSLPQALEKSRGEYLHGDQDGEVEMPHVVVAAPEIPDDPHAVVELQLEPRWAKYHYVRPHEQDDVCNKFQMKVYDLNDEVHRPVPPSEGRGYTTTHPNCICWWEEIANPSQTTEATDPQVKEFSKIKGHITRKAKKHELHTVKPDGTLSSRTRGTNPMREAIMEVRQDFKWLSEEYLQKVKELPVEGKMFLIKASEEAITDHRGEGYEPFRRWLSPDELHAMARTATGKGMDLNHHPEWRTDSQVMDSEYDKELKQIQMIVNEADPEVLAAIANGTITAVSINGGAPRDSTVECPTDECFVVPRGVILGELDDIALTWVVTNPSGMNYKGNWIPPAKPGVKTTAIQPL